MLVGVIVGVSLGVFDDVIDGVIVSDGKISSWVLVGVLVKVTLCVTVGD